MSEFSHPVRVDTIGDAPRTLVLVADHDQRRALAGRFGLEALDRLEAEVALRSEGQAILAEGRLSAAVVQACVATGDPVSATLDEPFALRFVAGTPDGDEIELSEQDLDTLTYEDGVIDVGEAIAETLSLALDPYPRAPDADARLRDAGVLEEGMAGPFASLKALRDRLG